MNNQRAAKILLAMGLALAVTSLYFGYRNFQKSISFEQAEGLITGFHTHKRDDSNHGWPNVTFVYMGDSIFSKIDYYNSGMEVGQTVTLIFPPNEPKSAEIKSSLWSLPLVLFFLSLFFIVPSLLIKRKVDKKSNISEIPDRLDRVEEPQKNSTGAQKSNINPVVGRFLFIVFSAVLVWLVVCQVRKELKETDSSIGWEGIIVIGLIALIFSIISLLSWFGTLIEVLSTDVDADFVKVVTAERTVIEDGKVKYKWKLECKWNNPRTGRQVIFTSEPFEGEEVFYNRNKIKVSVLLQMPKAFYAVDLSFISNTEQTGIPLVDSLLRRQVEETELIFKAEEAKRKLS